jgi:phosphoglycerol transferase MdoB-like AlkP superfamily enzyme
MKKLFYKLSIVALCIYSVSCKEKEEAIPKLTFEKDVAPITKLNCVPCHLANSGANFEARKKHVDSYAITKEFASTILDRIQRDPTAQGFMPRGKPKLSDTDIATIKQWVADGMIEK